MFFNTVYQSPVGEITLACNEQEKLVGAWLKGQKYFGGTIGSEFTANDNLEIFRLTKDWLNRYFKGDKPKIETMLCITK